MRSLPARRLALLLSILILSLASAGCPELNRQPDYLGRQTVSNEATLPTIAVAQADSSARPILDHASIMVSN